MKFSNPLRLLILIASFAAFAWAQGQGSAAISGTVRDASGSVVAGAKVTVTQTSTGVRRLTQTNSAGQFSAPSLAPGRYSVSIANPGFKTQVENVTILADQSRALNVKLQVGQVTETVTVNTSAVHANTTSPVLSQVIDRTRVVGLPLIARNTADLTLLVPGTTSANGHGVQQGNTKQIPGTEAISVNGARPDQIAYNLDGASNEDPMGNTNAPFPFPDATQEFSVQTNSFAIQYGANAGGVVNVVTKSGTNDWHGDGFEFVRNKMFNARQFGASKVDPLHQNQFGGTIGGPIRHDHSFIFFGYQGTRLRNIPSLNTTHLPTAAEQAGNFSALCTAGFNSATQLCNNPAPGQQIYNGFTGQPLPNNQITNISPVATNMLKFLPTSAENASGFAQYTGARDVENDNQFVVRFDQTVGQQNHFTARLFLDHYTSAPQFNGTNLLTITTGSVIQSQNWLFSYIWVPAPDFVNTTYFGVIRLASDRTQGGNVPQLTDLGASLPELPKSQGGERGFGVSGYFGFGGFTDGRFIRNTATWRDNAVWTHGNHTIQFGGDYERDRGIARNTDVMDAAISITSDVTGNALASFMEGYLNSLTQSSGNYSDQVQRPTGLYIGDTWRASSRLTLTGGLRWEPFVPEREVYGRFEQFIPAAFNAGLHSQRIPTAPPGIFFQGDCYKSYCIPNSGEGGSYWNFAPRVGFAFDVFGNQRTVIRGGAGVFYSTRLSTFFLNDPSIAPPFSLSINLSAGTVGPLGQPDINEPLFVKNYPERYTLATVPGNVQFPNGVRVWTLQPNTNWITPTTYDWNLTLEHQFSSSTLLRLSYVGTRGTHLRQDNELNPGQYALWVARGCTSYSQAGCSTDSRRPYQGLTNVYLSTNNGNSSYNAFQATLQKRPFAQGMFQSLTLLASYTWSKAMVDPLAQGGGITDIGSAGDGGTSGLPYGAAFTGAWDTGPADFNHTNEASISYVWQLPMFRQSNSGFLRTTLGGWNWGGIFSARSGDMLTIMAGQDTSRTGLGGERAVFAGSSSQFGGNGGGNPSSCVNSKGQQIANPCVPYFNTAIFKAPGIGQFGNVGLDSFTGPANWNYDMDLMKDFFPVASNENLHLQLRGDFFNFFNHTQLNDPNTTLTASTFGRITGAAGPRIIQLALKVYF